MFEKISIFIWGLPTITAILGTGCYLTYKLKFMQITNIGNAFKILSHKNESAHGEIAPIQALFTALSATVGTGNIAGVATAIYIGGPGAIFWMWVSAIFGMATKYSEAYFAVKFRETNSKHEFVGGPMYFIKNGLGRNWYPLAAFYAVCAGIASFGIGNAVQVNTVANSLNFSTKLPNLYIGLFIGFVVAIVLLGGIKRIANFATKLVPLMAIIYILVATFCLAHKSENIIPSLLSIFHSAFDFDSAAGGGIGFLIAMRSGIARGIFSNEAGLGSAAIAHAAAKTDNPHNQGLIAMLGVFIDTIILCTITGLIILTSGVNLKSSMLLTKAAVGKSISYGGDIIGICLTLFAFTSIIGWSYYGEKCWEFVFGEKSRKVFRVLWVIMIPIAAIMKIEIVWSIADILNATMAYPNLIALFFLASKYFKTNRF